MDFSLNEEQRSWQLKARKFAQEEIAPISLERDAIADPGKTFDWDIIKKGSKLGFRTAALSKEWGGHGIDSVTQAAVIMELSKGDFPISKSFSQCWKWSQSMAALCTPEQKERFLKPFVAEDSYLLGCAITEPNAGSDNRVPPESDPRAGYRLRAQRDGDDWILNGDKCFIAHGPVAKLFFVFTRTNPEVSIRDGTTLFLMTRDTPGFRVGKVFNKAGWRFYQNAELIFENARIPHANVVGEVNCGGKGGTVETLGFGEIELASSTVGICDAAVEMAMKHVRACRVSGKYLGEHQSIQLKLSTMHVLTEALRSYVMRTAWARDQAGRGDKTARVADHAHFVMTFSKDVIQQVTTLNMEIHGAAGAAMHAGAEKLFRDGVTMHVSGDVVQRTTPIKHLLR